MNEERKKWLEKYNVKIAENGFIAEYCIPEHVKCILLTNGNTYFIGFDGKRKAYGELTEEEKEDYKQQCKKLDISRQIQQSKDIRRKDKDGRDDR